MTTALVAVIFIVGVVALISTADNEVENIEQVVAEQPRELDLTLEYKEAIQEEYISNLDGNDFVITTAEVTPKIDTSELGTFKHEVEIDGEIFSLTIIIEDNRELVLNALDELVVETESMSQKEVEDLLIERFSPEESEELDFDFSYPEGFDLDSEGEYEVTVTAQFANNPENNTIEKVFVKVQDPEGEEVIEEENQVENEAAESIEVAAGNNNSRNHSESSNTSGNTSDPGNTEPNEPTPPEPKPKSEEAPAPEPAPKSDSDSESERQFGPDTRPRDRDVPAGVPSSAKIVEEESNPDGHWFKYHTTLPNGGTIDTLVVALDNPAVLISGYDNSGNSFGSDYTRAELRFMWSLPDLEFEDHDALEELSIRILDAYGF